MSSPASWLVFAGLACFGAPNRAISTKSRHLAGLAGRKSAGHAKTGQVGPAQVATCGVGNDRSISLCENSISRYETTRDTESEVVSASLVVAAQRASAAWIPITIAAATFQTARTATQQRLRKVLSISAAGFVRYAYGAPLAWLATALVVGSARYELPSIPLQFWPIVTVAGVAQIFGTILLIRSFDARDYATGTVFSKTEVVQVALFSAIFLGEGLRAFGWVAVAICMTGVVLLASKQQSIAGVLHVLRRFDDLSARCGVAAGGCFALAAVAIRAASKSLGPNEPAVVRAFLTLAIMNSIQTVVHGAYLYKKEPDQLVKSFAVWRSSAIVGVLSVCGSAGWALAVTLQNAARVRILGQVELLFTFAIAHFWLRERHVRREYLASGLVLMGVVGVVVLG